MDVDKDGTSCKIAFPKWKILNSYFDADQVVKSGDN